MTLNDILQLVAASSDNDWHPLEFDGSAPVSVSFVHPEDGFSAHPLLLVHRTSPEVSIAVGLPSNQDLASEHGSIGGSSSSVPVVYADILFNGAPVYRLTLINVDNGHCYFPNPGADGHGGWTVTRAHADIARVVNALTVRGDFDRLFESSGFAIDG